MNRRTTGRARFSDRGFTLVEMMVVISIILILIGLAVPVYNHSVTHAREENLRKNLNTLNFMIYQYTQDRQKAPQSLDDLKSAGYIKEVPEDITGSVETWELEQNEGMIMSLYQTDAGGIVGVHSGSHQTASDGTAYSTW